jgi:hypothetical protein
MNYPLPQPMTLDQLLRAQRQDALRDFDISGEGHVEAGSQRWAWYAVTPKAGSKQVDDRLTKIDYMTIRGTQAYVLHFMVERDKVGDYQPEFEEIVRSVVFRGTLPSAAGQEQDAIPAHIRHPEAFEQGRLVGRIVTYSMIAVVYLNDPRRSWSHHLQVHSSPE